MISLIYSLLIVFFFVPFFLLFNDLLARFFYKVSDRDLKSHVEDIAKAGLMMHKFKVDFDIATFDYEILNSNIPKNEKAALLSFASACQDYNIHYLYVVDKGSNKVLANMSSLKLGNVELHIK